MKSDFEKILLTKEQIAARVREMAAELDRDYAGKDTLFVGILKGSVFFYSDLLLALTIPAEIDFMSVSSYGLESATTGSVHMIKDLDRPVDGKHIIIVEDIVDSGTTLAYLQKLLASRNPASVKICALLNKPERRKTPVTIDYCGFDIPDEFIVGYGLDYAERYRLSRDVYALKRSVYEK